MTTHLPKPRAGRFIVEHIAGVGYVVVSPGGMRVSGPQPRDQAVNSQEYHQQQADRKAKRGPRPCLCCGATFDSEGPHNRMCGPCRLRGDDASSYRYINPRRRSG